MDNAPEENKKKKQQNNRIYQIFLLISSILAIVCLTVLIIVSRINSSKTLFCAILFVIFGLWSVIFYVLNKSAEEHRRDKESEDMAKVLQAMFELTRKSQADADNKIQQMSEEYAVPAEEIINAIKALAKVTIGRTKENADALMNSNAVVAGKIADMQADIQTLTEKSDRFSGSTPATPAEQQISGASNDQIRKLTNSIDDVLHELKRMDADIERLEQSQKALVEKPPVIFAGSLVSGNVPQQGVYSTEPQTAEYKPDSIAKTNEDTTSDTDLDLDIESESDNETVESDETTDDELSLDTDESTDDGLSLDTDETTDDGLSLDTDETTDDGLSLDTDETTDDGLSLDTETDDDLSLDTDESTNDGLSLDADTDVDNGLTLDEDTKTDDGLSLDTDAVVDDELNLDSDLSTDTDLTVDAGADDDLGLDVDSSINEDSTPEDVEPAPEEKAEEPESTPDEKPQEPGPAPEEPAPEPETNAAPISNDPNAKLSPEQIAALFASANAGSDSDSSTANSADTENNNDNSTDSTESEKKPEDSKPEAGGDPNRMMTPEEIEALFAKVQ